jgi:hypothetical protein
MHPGPADTTATDGGAETSPPMHATTTPQPAGRIIGRRACPWCGFAHSHVRQAGDKFPYHYCPQCGHKTQSVNGAQAKLITDGMKAEPKYGPVPQIPRRPDDIVIAAPAQPAPTRPKKAGPWDQLLTTTKRSK